MDTLNMPPTGGAFKELSPRHAAAIAYIEAGIPVFPCLVGDKKPATLHGFKDKTTDRARVDELWAQADYNVAIVPEDAGWCVVDLDVKADGIETWQKLYAPSEPFRIVRTPSGGFHLYFRGSLPSTVRNLGPGIDTRGRDGYVLIPPSVVNGKPYAVEEDRPKASGRLPDGVVEKLASSGQHEPREAPDGVELDDPATIAWAQKLLAATEPPVEGERNDKLHRIAKKLFDGDRPGYSLSIEMATDLLHEWAPYITDRFEEPIANAWKHRQNGIGCGPPPAPEPDTRTDEEVFAEVEPPAPVVFPRGHRGSALRLMKHQPV
jgi:hypothetical protein